MKSALVTGANKGIGLEVARILAQKGFYVYIGARYFSEEYFPESVQWPW